FFRFHANAAHEASLSSSLLSLHTPMTHARSFSTCQTLSSPHLPVFFFFVLFYTPPHSRRLCFTPIITAIALPSFVPMTHPPSRARHFLSLPPARSQPLAPAVLFAFLATGGSIACDMYCSCMIRTAHVAAFAFLIRSRACFTHF